MKHIPWSFASLVVLAFAGWQSFGTLARTPAFNPALRTEAPSGRTWPQFIESMYSHADYLYWIAFEWQHSPGGAANPGDGAGDVGAFRTRDAARDSLRLRPGDPGAWMLLAKAEAALGEGHRALEAYKTAQSLAPYSALGAVDRVYFLIQFMSDPEGQALALATVRPEVVRSDLETMRLRPGFDTTAEQLARHPAMAGFLGG